MTWVIGATSPLGAAYIISDTRVTFSNGTERDLIQKSYCLAPNIVGGFSGSVRIGFELLAHLSWRLGGIESLKAWEPLSVARHWPQEAEDIFNSHSIEEKKLGCSILLAGVSPTQKNGSSPWARPYLFRLAAPEFKAGHARNGFTALQIGSGTEINSYKQLVREFFRSQVTFGRYASLGGQGMAAALAMFISSEIQAHPVPGVGPTLHVVSCGTEGPNQNIGIAAEPDREQNFPALATNYSEFCRLANENSAAADCALC